MAETAERTGVDPGKKKEKRGNFRNNKDAFHGKLAEEVKKFDAVLSELVEDEVEFAGVIGVITDSVANKADKSKEDVTREEVKRRVEKVGDYFEQGKDGRDGLTLKGILLGQLKVGRTTVNRYLCWRVAVGMGTDLLKDEQIEAANQFQRDIDKKIEGVGSAEVVTKGITDSRDSGVNGGRAAKSKGQRETRPMPKPVPDEEQVWYELEVDDDGDETQPDPLQPIVENVIEGDFYKDMHSDKPEVETSGAGEFTKQVEQLYLIEWEKEFAYVTGSYIASMLVEFMPVPDEGVVDWHTLQESLADYLYKVGANTYRGHKLLDVDELALFKFENVFTNEELDDFQNWLELFQETTIKGEMITDEGMLEMSKHMKPNLGEQKKYLMSMPGYEEVLDNWVAIQTYSDNDVVQSIMKEVTTRFYERLGVVMPADVDTDYPDAEAVPLREVRLIGGEKGNSWAEELLGPEVVGALNSDSDFENVTEFDEQLASFDQLFEIADMTILHAVAERRYPKVDPEEVEKVMEKSRSVMGKIWAKIRVLAGRSLRKAGDKVGGEPLSEFDQKKKVEEARIAKVNDKSGESGQKKGLLRRLLGR